jgi:hypothetical protein
MVKTEPKFLNPEIKYESVNYIGLIPVLIASIQEQQKQIEELKAMVKQLSRERNIKTASNNVILEQNKPNPFIHNTTMVYSLPENFTNAQIKITGRNGKTLKTINISDSRKGAIKCRCSIAFVRCIQLFAFCRGQAGCTKQMERLK